MDYAESGYCPHCRLTIPGGHRGDCPWVKSPSTQAIGVVTFSWLPQTTGAANTRTYWWLPNATGANP